MNFDPATLVTMQGVPSRQEVHHVCGHSAGPAAGVGGLVPLSAGSQPVVAGGSGRHSMVHDVSELW